MTLIVEVRERNWEQGLYLDSKQDPDTWQRHLAEKEVVEKRWQQLVDFRGEDGCDSVLEDGSEGGADDDDESDDSLSDDGFWDDDDWHHGEEFEVATPRWLRAEHDKKAALGQPSRGVDGDEAEESDVDDNAFFDALDGSE